MLPHFSLLRTTAGKSGLTSMLYFTQVFLCSSYLTQVAIHLEKVAVSEPILYLSIPFIQLSACNQFHFNEPRGSTHMVAARKNPRRRVEGLVPPRICVPHPIFLAHCVPCSFNNASSRISRDWFGGSKQQSSSQSRVGEAIYYNMHALPLRSYWRDRTILTSR